MPRIIREPPAGDRQGVGDDTHSGSIPIRPFAAALAAKGRSVFDEASCMDVPRRSSLHSRISSAHDRWSETTDDDKLLRNQRPPLLSTDRDVLEVAFTTIGAVEPQAARAIRIKSTLEVDTIYISEALVSEVAGNPRVKVIGQPEPLAFDTAGNLL